MDRDDKTPENKPAPPVARTAPDEDVMEIVTVEEDGAAKHRVWAKVAKIITLAIIFLVVWFNNPPKQVYDDAKNGLKKVWEEIRTKGDQTFLDHYTFQSATTQDKYIAATITSSMTASVNCKKWGSSAERILFFDVTFDYYIELNKGFRIEAMPMKDGRRIVTCFFSDLKLDTPVKQKSNKKENVKDGFLIDEEDMVNEYLTNRLQVDLKKEGESVANLAVAKQQAEESLRILLQKTLLPDFPWQQAFQVSIIFDSAKLDAPAARTFTLSQPVPEGRPSQGGGQ